MDILELTYKSGNIHEEDFNLYIIYSGFYSGCHCPCSCISASTETSAKYISEVKVGYAKKADNAKAALDGYTILKDKNENDIDLNDSAGVGSKTKGDMCVYFGYKTTDDAKKVSEILLL